MADFVLSSVRDRVGVITLNRPDCLNAWHSPMRQEVIAALRAFEADADVGAIVLTGAGDRAFCAGQDLNEAQHFDSDDAEAWMREWEMFYDLLRRLTKPLIMALNGLAAGSAFQVALLGDIRIGHSEVRMGQPEINAGIASVTGPWIMKEMLGMSRTVELTLTGRLMDADEAWRIGLIHHLVARDQVMPKALEVGRELASKPRLAMRLDKQWLREMTEATFQAAIEGGIRIHRQAYGSGEPAQKMSEFFDARRDDR